MLRRIPVIPTIVVMIAIGIMVRLGFWQIDRMQQKEALLAMYASNESDKSVHRWEDGDLAAIAYTTVAGKCVKVRGISAQAGRNADGDVGWAQVAECDMQGISPARVILGWSKQPPTAKWSGGPFSGTYVPPGNKKRLLEIVADPPLAGLAANARPDPKDLPNNHWSYAIQWFLFSVTALVIYGLALRKRLQA